VVIGMLLFIARHARNPVRRVQGADQRSSRRIRPAAQARALRAHGAAIVVIELEGPLFFGTADAAAREIERRAAAAESVIVDFHRVPDVDVNGAQVLLQAAAALDAAGRTLLVAALHEGGGPLRAIRGVDVHGQLARAQLFADVDLALEAAEDRLLERLQAMPAGTRALALHETLLGEGLADDELHRLGALLVECRFACGEAVFRQGEPGDSLYVALRGRVAIWRRGGAGLPERRLVSFTPGVVFGEMAMLSGEPRSADGVAEEDVVLLMLSRAAFERLSADAPALAAKLLRKLQLHLAARLRTVTDELQALHAAP
jgi:SulP family sulfate permease